MEFKKDKGMRKLIDQTIIDRRIASAPGWFYQLNWSTPHDVTTVRNKNIPCYSGVYAFSSDDNPHILSSHIVYLGRSLNLNYRVPVYLRRLKKYSSSKPSKQISVEMLVKYYKEKYPKMFVRWAGVVGYKDVEGGLISLFDPEFNFRDENDQILPDDALLPEDWI